MSEWGWFYCKTSLGAFIYLWVRRNDPVRLCSVYMSRIGKSLRRNVVITFIRRKLIAICLPNCWCCLTWQFQAWSSGREVCAKLTSFKDMKCMLSEKKSVPNNDSPFYQHSSSPKCARGLIVFSCFHKLFGGGVSKKRSKFWRRLRGGEETQTTVLSQHSDRPESSHKLYSASCK